MSLIRDQTMEGYGSRRFFVESPCLCWLFFFSGFFLFVCLVGARSHGSYPGTRSRGPTVTHVVNQKTVLSFGGWQECRNSRRANFAKRPEKPMRERIDRSGSFPDTIPPVHSLTAIHPDAITIPSNIPLPYSRQCVEVS